MVKPKRIKRARRGSSPFSKLLRWGIVAALAVGVALLSYHLIKDYKSTFALIELVELVGEPSEGGMVLRVGDGIVAEEILGKLRRLERSSFDAMKITGLNRKKGLIEGNIEVGGVKYPFTLIWGRLRGESPSPLLAIVIDDVGGNLEMAKRAANLPVEVTLSIIPHLRHSSGIAAALSKRSIPFMLHMPMEPRNYPEQNPGEGAIMADASPAEARGLIRKALSSVKGASGLNNHMGSAATENPELMEAVIAEAKNQGLFFIDSYTSAKSIALEKAAQAGIKRGKRDIFLDNEREEGKIIENLKKAVAVAKKEGSAIAIGHLHEETLAAISRWHLEGGVSGIEVVYAGEVVTTRKSR